MRDNRKIVFDKLIEYIAIGTFQPNKKLYSENALARMLGVKRNDVRDAIMALELMGLIKRSQGKGAFLTHFGLTDAANPFSLIVMLQKGSPEEIMNIRLLLESEAAKLAAINRTEEDLVKMHKTLKTLEDGKIATVCAKVDADFHSLIAKASGNKLLKTLVHFVFGYISYVSLNNWTMLVHPENKLLRLAIIDQHKALYQAIYDGCPETAVKSIYNHFDFIGTSLNQKIKKEFDDYEKQKSLLWT